MKKPRNAFDTLICALLFLPTLPLWFVVLFFVLRARRQIQRENQARRERE